MGVVNEPVKHGIRYRGVRHHLVPVVDRELTGDDGGAVAVAIIEDLQELAALAFVRLPSAPALLRARNNFGA